MNVKMTSTMGVVSMSASTFLATTDVHAMMGSCWPMMATTVLVSSECWKESFDSWLWQESDDLVAFYFVKNLIQIQLKKLKCVH